MRNEKIYFCFLNKYLFWTSYPTFCPLLVHVQEQNSVEIITSPPRTVCFAPRPSYPGQSPPSRLVLAVEGRDQAGPCEEVCGVTDGLCDHFLGFGNVANWA